LDFLDINFGYASAEREGADAPDLLLRGYLDHGDVAREALEGSRFLFLGYKGSGKSAIGERARLLAAGDPMLFANHAVLDDFPYDALMSSVPDEHSEQDAWSWLLLLRVLESLRLDEAAMAEDADFHRSIAALTKLGFLPARDLRTIVLTSVTKQLKINLPKIAEFVTERHYETPTLALDQLVSHMVGLVSHFRSGARHVLIIDGLDEVLALTRRHYEAIAAMLLAVARLNTEFRRWEAPVKIVVLCRLDLFDRIPGANKNKLRRDWGLELDWYHDPRQPDSSALMQLANLRASVSLGAECNVMRRYFPPNMREGETRRVLLDHTRHTPRDFGQLLGSIQSIARASLRPRQTALTRDQIVSGLRDYSIAYFLPEIRDELDGYLGTEAVAQVIATLAATRQREFDFTELQAAAERVDAANLELEEVVRALFDCSALGVIQKRRTSRGSTTYFTFKYRNHNSAVAMSERFILHRGVWKALNLI
jgi:hypothetical protein